MSWNATADRLRAQAQQYGLANDYVTAKVLYEAVDEIERIARERDEARAQADGMREALEAIASRGEVFDCKGTHSKWVCGMARAALAALPTAPKLTTVETWAGGKLLRVHTEASSPEGDDDGT